MRRLTRWSFLLGTGISLLAVPLSMVRADGPARPANAQQVRPLAFPAGIELNSGAPAEGIKSGLAKLTERALTKDSFGKMLDELSDPDRDRAKEFKGVDQAKLNILVDKIRENWVKKYGKEFSVDTKIVFGSPLQIIEGEVKDSAVALTTWPVAATSELAMTASARVIRGDTKDIKNVAKAEKLEKDRHLALVWFPPMHEMPDLTVSMIHHLPMSWRVDVPDDRSGAQIYNDLVAHLTYIGDHADQWPNNVDEAARGVAYHVAAALYGVNTVPAVKG